MLMTDNSSILTNFNLIKNIQNHLVETVHTKSEKVKKK